MNTIENIKERFQELSSSGEVGVLSSMSKKAVDSFNEMGVPSVKHEEWKYTRIGGFFNQEYSVVPGIEINDLSSTDIDLFRLPGHEKVSELVFVNGYYSGRLSHIRSASLTVLSLGDASKNEFAGIVSKYLGNSGKYLKDGIFALNTAFVQDGLFIHIKKGAIEPPVYIYNITDSRSSNILAQPRTLIYISEQAHVQLIETYTTIGSSESFTNQVTEIVVEKDALVEYYKIQNDAIHSSQVSATSFQQVGKSYVHAVTVSLNGGVVRNNLNISLAAERSEAHLYGLYFLKGDSHIDNHTVVDHIVPNCESNELYKGIVDDKGAAVFNGKIFVQPQAQKTNAFQSNKNILMSDTASVNTKPQLEIFADDVKCSHGCTVGQLDEEGLFYLQSRGINEKMARSLLVHAFAVNILEHIKPAPIRDYVDRLIDERLEFDKL
ncbi:MAG: Fe-S cluster assembly protein SufD [Flavitalea sp.]